MAAAVWGAGSLNGVSWDQVGPAAHARRAPAAGGDVEPRPMRQMELGDDAARSGVRARTHASAG